VYRNRFIDTGWKFIDFDLISIHRLFQSPSFLRGGGWEEWAGSIMSGPEVEGGWVIGRLAGCPASLSLRDLSV
jgi:hypothetical protein